MSGIVFLDTGPLGEATNPGRTGAACRGWLASLEAAGIVVFIPEIAEFELRRKLIHGRERTAGGLARLEDLLDQSSTVGLDRPTMLRAARLWAELRWAGRATAADDALDGDVLIAAQALETIDAMGLDVPAVIATTNARHLGRVPGVIARRWQDLDPAWLAANVPG